MQSSDNRLLFGALGCGIILACALVGYFIYIVQNLHNLPQTALTVDTVSPITPTDISIYQTAKTTFPTALPTTVEKFLRTPIPSPTPGSFGEVLPMGKIAFACNITQIDQICIMNADGTNFIQLTDFQATAYYPSISPDGETVYFSSKQNEGFEIYSISVSGGKVKQLTNDIGSLYAPELSPDQKWLVFTNNGHGLWLMRPDGKNPHPLSDRDDIDPTWSPDGSMIAFASSRMGPRQLFVMNADGSNVRQVTNLDNMGGRSSFSPSGMQLAFYRGQAGDHNIYIINVDGSGLVQLTNGGDNLGPSWSPDGNWIAFTSFRDGNNEIYIIHPDGTDLRRLTDSSTSDWQPRWGK